jgi:hypothetical protein
MQVTVVAILCHLLTPAATLAPDRDCTAEEVRVEEIVTDTDLDPSVTFQGCMIGGQAALAKWKGEHPIYSRAGWRVGRVLCVPGHYEIRGAA